MSDVIDGSIIYTATPFRFSDKKIEEICDFVESTGNFPFHPLKAMPLSRYNYDRYSSRVIFEVCFKCVDYVADEVWIFGIGSGSLKEYARAKEQGKPIKSLIKVFDNEWEIYSKKEKYWNVFGEIFKEVLDTSRISI